MSRRVSTTGTFRNSLANNTGNTSKTFCSGVKHGGGGRMMSCAITLPNSSASPKCCFKSSKAKIPTKRPPAVTTGKKLTGLDINRFTTSRYFVFVNTGRTGDRIKSPTVFCVVIPKRSTSRSNKTPRLLNGPVYTSSGQNRRPTKAATADATNNGGNTK